MKLPYVAHLQDPYVGCGDIILSKRVGSRTVHHVDLHANSFALLHIPPPVSTSFLLTACHWDNSFRCISIADGRVVRTIRAHNDVVTCIAGEHLSVVLRNALHSDKALLKQVAHYHRELSFVVRLWLLWC